MTRDAELGLGASGQILATADGVALERAPRNARGIVRIVVDGNGRISDVISTSPSWEAAARAMGKTLEGRRFDVPMGSRGLVVDIAVEARSTQVPAVITGEASQQPVAWAEPLRGVSPSDAPSPVVVVPIESLLPVPRHVVSIALLRVEPR